VDRDVIAAATGTAPQEQAWPTDRLDHPQHRKRIGLAVFTVIAEIGTDGKTGKALTSATADGEFRVVLSRGGMAVGLLATFLLKRHRGRPRPEPRREALVARDRRAAGVRSGNPPSGPSRAVRSPQAASRYSAACHIKARQGRSLAARQRSDDAHRCHRSIATTI